MIWKKHLKHPIEYILNNIIYIHIIINVNRKSINTRKQTINYITILLILRR